MSRILRAELKQVLEPFSQQIDRKLDAVIDSLSQDVSKHAQGLLDVEVEPKSSLTGRSGHAKGPLLLSTISTNSNFDTRTRFLERKSMGCLSSEVKLSMVWHEYESRFGGLTVFVSKFRARGHCIAGPSKEYFRIRVDFRPAHWISSRGLSAIYSTSQDSFGYFSICPSMFTFRTLPDSSEVWHVVQLDDVTRLRHMLRYGEVNWRDQDEWGECLLNVSELDTGTKSWFRLY